MSEKLKPDLAPCPYCNGAPTRSITEGYDRETLYYLICCEKCGTIGEFVSDQQSGIDEWNSRPIEDALQERLNNAYDLLRQALSDATPASRWMPEARAIVDRWDEEKSK